MKYSKYEYIVSIAEFNSISEAAKKLYITQPALTKIINNLEQELGVKLFNRTTHPIRLTYAGQRYIAEVKKILEIQRHLEKEMEEISNMSKGRLVIGISSSRAALWLPHILPDFQREYSGIELKIVEGTFSFLEEQLLKEVIDVILTSLPIFSDEIEYEVLAENQVILVVPQNHPVLHDLDVTQNDPDNLIYINPQKLNSQPFITLIPGQGLHRMTWQIFEQYNIKPGNILEISNIEAAYRLAAAGMGLTFTTKILTLCTLPTMVPVLCTIDRSPRIRASVAAYKKNVCLTASARRFIDMTRETIQNSPFLQPYDSKKWQALKNLSKYDMTSVLKGV